MSTELVKTDQMQERINQLETWGKMYREENIAVLGDNQVFLRRNETGVLKSIKGVVELKERNGELALVQGKFMTTGVGFYSLNRIANLSIITPDKLQLPDGQYVVNPYLVLDPKSQSVTKVWTKKYAVGYGPTGSLSITSATLMYDISGYFVQDLLKKITNNSACGRVCIEQMVTDEEKQKGAFFRVEGDMGVWADFTNKEVLKAIETLTDSKRFGDRKAQTICERNAMKKHPALSHTVFIDVDGPDKQHVSKVPVVGYIHDLSINDLLDLTEKVDKGEKATLNGKNVEIIDIGVHEATEVDMTEDLGGEE